MSRTTRTGLLLAGVAVLVLLVRGLLVLLNLKGELLWQLVVLLLVALALAALVVVARARDR